MTLLLQDRPLLDAFRRGETTALSTVYQEYVRPLHAMLSDGFTFGSGDELHRFAGYRAAPWKLENAIQETFARAFAPSARLGYDGLRPYRNYLFAIARNLIVDQTRLDAREVAADPFQLPTVDVDRALGAADEQVLDREVVAQCEAFLACLDQEQRALFEARFHQGFSVERVAQALGISEHQVKRGERLLKRRFFRMMKACGYFEGYRLDKAGLAKVAHLLLLYAAVRGR